MMRQRDIDINSNDNTLFVTEQCNNHCLMCCQPPKTVSDIDVLYTQNINRIKSAPKDLPVIGITGGEPTLLENRLTELVRIIRTELPNTDIQILSNGRKFRDASYAKELVEAGGDKLFLGIPIHSDYAKDHDLIAGAKHAYVETILGLYNLAMESACIELRVIVNKLNYTRLPHIANFIHKNLPFVSWTAFIGMERTGLADTHANHIWFEPKDYVKQLCEAVQILAGFHHDAVIYNIPLCLLPAGVHHFAKKSISDWKNSFSKLCDNCAAKKSCCGLFSTSSVEYQGLKAYSSYDTALTDN